METESQQDLIELDSKRHSYRKITDYLRPCKIYKRGKVVEYLNIATSFDIETTSFFRNRETLEIIDTIKAQSIDESDLRRNWEKIAIMYVWVFCYRGHCFVGRTWNQFKWFLNKIIEYHELNENRIMIVGVHNLAYEFQFLRKLFAWSSVFAVKERTPVYARTITGIEFRCTYLLSGYGLEKVGEHLQKYKVNKLIGALDYNKLRHSSTKIFEKEWAYIVNDGLVAFAYLQELIEANKRITYIPLTKTGFVRKYLRKECYFSKSSHKRDVDHKYREYRTIMLGSTIGSADEYDLLKKAFTGAIVHANAYHSGVLLNDVMSMDETSAYPTQLAIGYFPCGKGEWIKPKDQKQFDFYVDKKACLIDLTFVNIEKSQLFESLISRSKALEIEDCEEDNGRIIKAKKLRIVITEIDYFVYKKFYKWEYFTINQMVVYHKKRLPTNFVKAVLELYAKKTTLKGVDGMEVEYMHSKENLNACYGASVTDICRDSTIYDGGEWVTIPCDVEKEIAKYNNSKNRFLCYQWGVWVTALARRALASAIYSIGKESDSPVGDYVYCDTDSVKFLNPEKHMKYFERYNAYMMNELKKASEYHHIPLEKFMPKDINGGVHPLGIWEDDGRYTRFKALGAKRYTVEYEKEHILILTDGSEYHTRHSLTIAGVNKRCAIPYIEAHEKDFFDFMHFGYLFNEDCCGKKLHTYIDEPKDGYLVDYLGKVGKFHEESAVHLMNTTYKMSASDDYADLLDCIVTEYINR